MNIKNCLIYFSIFILIISILLYFSFDTSYIEIEITDQNSKAKCMDGSNYKFLYSKGFGNGTNSFYIYFEAGGFCGDENYDPKNEEAPLQLCEKRITNRLGTNKFLPLLRYFNPYISRFFTSSKYFNPIFYNWNKVYIKYCDGTLYMGNEEKPIQYKNLLFYIRGEENVKSVFNYLTKNKNLNNAKNVLVSGSSAGAIAVNIYSKYIRSLLSSKTNYKVISDSGFFHQTNYNLIYKNLNIMQDMMIKLKNSFHLSKTKTMIDLNPKNDFIDFIQPKTFINNYEKDFDFLFLTSAYDSWALSRLLKIRCFFGKNVYNDCNETEINMFEKYSNELIDEIENIIEKDKNGKITAWIPKGFYHMFICNSWSWNIKKYGVGGYSVQSFINDWYYDLLPKNKKMFYDKKDVKKKLVDFFWFINYLKVKF